MIDRVLRDLKLAVGVFMNGDEKNARLLLDEKVQMRDLERDMTANHLRRLREQRQESLETSSLHIDIARDLEADHGAFCFGWPIPSWKKKAFCERRGSLSESVSQAAFHLHSRASLSFPTKQAMVRAVMVY